MLGGGGEDVSIVPVVHSRGTVSVLSLGYFSSVGSSSKPSHPSLPVSLGSRHIQEYFKDNRGRKRKSIKPQQEKARHEKRTKQSKMIVQAKLVVGYWELISLESGYELLAPQERSTVRVTEERNAAKKQRNYWWTEDNCTRLKKKLANSRYPYLRGQCDEACLELGLDPVPKKKLLNVLQRVGRNPITYQNAFPTKKRELQSENQVKYVEDIIVKRDTANLDISRNNLIQVI